MKNVTEKILPTFLENVAFSSWNEASLKKSYLEAGFPKEKFNIDYTNGIESFTAEIVEKINQEALKKIERKFENVKSITEKANLAIYLKILEYHQTLRTDKITSNLILKKFSGYSALPLNSFNSISNIFSFSDNCWRMLNDKSTDFSFYTKRFSFSVIYLKSFLFSLSDNSKNLEKTQDFIRRAIDELINMSKYKSEISSKVNLLFKNLTSPYIKRY